MPLYCCIVDCKNTNANSDCKFYRFPQRPWKLYQREKWITAINRKNPDGSRWEPKLHTAICSAHFIGNQKSDNVLSPSFVPTIFPDAYKRRNVNEVAVLSRFERFMERKALKDQQCGTGENVMSIAEALVQYQYGHMEDLDPRGEVPLGPLLQTKNDDSSRASEGTSSQLPSQTETQTPIPYIKKEQVEIKEEIERTPHYLSTCPELPTECHSQVAVLFAENLHALAPLRVPLHSVLAKKGIKYIFLEGKKNDRIDVAPSPCLESSINLELDIKTEIKTEIIDD